MKKILITIGVAAFAVSLQAASVSWKINNITTFDSTTDKIASGSNYTILLCYSSDSTVSIDLSSGTVNYNGDALIASTAPLGTGGLKSTGSKFEYDYAQGSYYYAVLYNSKGTTSASAYDYYAVSAALTGNPVAVSPDSPLTLQFSATTVGTPAWSTATVPEPTTGLILMFGIAGLTLRRRRS